MTAPSLLGNEAKFTDIVIRPILARSHIKHGIQGSDVINLVELKLDCVDPPLKEK